MTDHVRRTLLWVSFFLAVLANAPSQAGDCIPLQAVSLSLPHGYTATQLVNAQQTAATAIYNEVPPVSDDMFDAVVWVDAPGFAAILYLRESLVCGTLQLKPEFIEHVRGVIFGRPS